VKSRRNGWLLELKQGSWDSFWESIVEESETTATRAEECRSASEEAFHVEWLIEIDDYIVYFLSSLISLMDVRI